MSPLASNTPYHQSKAPYWQNMQRNSWTMNPYDQQQFMNMQQQPYIRQRMMAPERQEDQLIRVQAEYPMVYQLIQEQQRIISDQKHSADNASNEIRCLQKQICRLQEDIKKHDDKIPPIIHVGKGQDSCGDDSSGFSSTKKRVQEFQECAQVTDVDTYDSLPFKKRMKKQRSRPDIARAMATLHAATSPTFTRNEKIQSFYF